MNQQHIPDSRCPLCGAMETTPYHEDRMRCYLQCELCRLVFVPPAFWLSHEEEKAVYDLHENDPHDAGYQRFLSRLTTPLLAHLAPQQQGLDFGCGPGPALPLLLGQQGHRVALYDPIYHNDPSVLTQSYDFITVTEVVEHLREPARTFNELYTLLRPGGWLAIMTKMVRDREAFSRWHYIRDMTHICFYAKETFTFLAEQYKARLVLSADDVILLHKGTPQEDQFPSSETSSSSLKPQ